MRKHKILFTAAGILFAALTCLCSCTAPVQVTGELPYDTATLSPDTVSKVSVVNVNIDWVIFGTAAELVNTATNVFSGKVVDVSFDVLDYDKGIPDMNGSSDNYHREIFTVYTIEVQKNYKGDIGETMKLYVEGGLPGYREEEQCQLVQDANLNGFTCVSNRVKLEIGESYLLCANKHEHYTGIVNMDQFAYYLNSQKANEIIRQCRKK